MTHAFLDRHCDLISPLHRLDPRAKIVGVFVAVAVMTSTPMGRSRVFLGYYAAILLLAAMSRVPVRHYAARCWVVSPFILMAAALPSVSGFVFEEPASRADPVDFGVAVLLKAYGAVLLLTMLTSTTRFHHLLWGLRLLRMPRVVNLIATLMYRHLFVLLEEWQSMARARRCRTPGALRLSRAAVYGKQIAMVFLRSWERGERVYAAMISRGFTGEFPLLKPGSFRASDAVFLCGLAIVFVALRFAPFGG